MSTTTDFQVGAVATLEADLTDFAGHAEDAGGLHWLVRDPSGVENDRSADVTHNGTGVYRLNVQCDAAGVWYWKVSTEGFVAVADGSFTVDDDYSIIGDPTKPVDLRVLVPRARRYCEGPYGPPEGRPSLGDEQLYAMVADGCADIIMLSGTLFGHKLLVTGRDRRVGFPIEWATEKVLEEWEGGVVTAQTALNHWFFIFRDLKTTQAIRNEGTEWSYSLSVNIMRDYIGQLRAARDNALDGLRKHHPVLDRFTSNIRVRDQATVAILEWWDHNSRGVAGTGLPGGQEASSIPWTPGWSGPGFVLA